MVTPSLPALALDLEIRDHMKLNRMIHDPTFIEGISCHLAEVEKAVFEKTLRGLQKESRRKGLELLQRSREERRRMKQQPPVSSSN